MSKLFVYGILKRGFDLDLTQYEAKFLGKAQLPGAILYGIHPLPDESTNERDGHYYFSGVGLRLTDDLRKVAQGEVFEIPDHLWNWLDDIENNGFSYTRRIVQAQVKVGERLRDGAPVCEPVDVWVYEHTYPGMKYQYPIENGVF